MFFSEAILSRRGPLAKVWLAAHMERKLSKTQTLQADIEQSVDAIMGQDAEVMALRLSGQLLLGVVRIYSRKAKYLLDDCNEALLKIKMAFRPGLVDMTDDQLAVNRNAITLQGGVLDLDALLPDINWDLDFEDRPVQPQGQHIARVADITLATADDLTFDFDDQGYGLDLGSADGMGAQDDDIELGLSFGDNEEILSVEQGRDAQAPRFSMGSNVLGDRDADGDLDMLSNVSRQMSERPFAQDADIFGGEFAADVELGITFDDNLEKTPVRTGSPSRASSPLTELPATPTPEVDLSTKKAPPSPAKKRKPKEKKQIIDAVTELSDRPGAGLARGRRAGFSEPMSKDVSNILTDHRFLPRSSTVMRLLEIREDPIAHFLPTKITPNGTFFSAAPPGLAPELAELFMRPVHPTFPKAVDGVDMNRSKRRRLMNGEEDEVEQARRAASVGRSVMEDSLGRGSVGPDFDFGDQTGLGLHDYEIPLPEFDVGGADVDRARSHSVALSRLSTPDMDRMPLDEGEKTYADLECSITMFDDRAQNRTQGPEAEPEREIDSKGYSKNTIKALSIIRKELHTGGVGQSRNTAIGFRKLSVKASRRAASLFFFELLVLGTRDCIQLKQAAPFENIEILAKDKLWERQTHTTGASSVGVRV